MALFQVERNEWSESITWKFWRRPQGLYNNPKIFYSTWLHSVLQFSHQFTSFPEGFQHFHSKKAASTWLELPPTTIFYHFNKYIIHQNFIFCLLSYLFLCMCVCVLGMCGFLSNEYESGGSRIDKDKTELVVSCRTTIRWWIGDTVDE